MRILSTLVAFFAVLVICAPLFGDPPTSADPIEPDEKTQRLMREVLNPPQDAIAEQQERKFVELLELASQNGPQLVQQAVLHEVRQPDRAREIAPYLILAQAHIAKRDYAEGLAPLLYCNDAGIREYARHLFPAALGCSCAHGHRDLSPIAIHVTSTKARREIAEPLTRAIYETMPGTALLLFQSEYDPKEPYSYRRNERIISNVLYEKRLRRPPAGEIDEKTKMALRELAESKFWWSRMFAAEIMVQHKEFRDPELIKRLLEDENKLVRQSVASIEKPDPLRFAKVDG